MNPSYQAGNMHERIARLEAQHDLLRKVVVRSFWQALDLLDEVTLPGRRMMCPICDRAETREHLEQRIDTCIFGGGRLERYVCPGCGCVYGPRKFTDLSPEMIDADYTLLYDSYAEGNSTDAEIRAFRSMAPKPGGSFLNWGCGRWSHSIPALRAEGFDVWGFEPSAGNADEHFVVTSRDQISARFVGIFSNNVIEHLVRPVDDFRYFHSILQPGGYMAHASPCYEYRYTFTRFHVIFLTGDAPYVLADRSGFRVMRREADGEFINCIFERM